MNDPVAYLALAQRPDIERPGEFDYTPVGSLWPTIEPADNHRDHCAAKAKADPARYGEVKYVVGEVRIVMDGGE